jgi:uncharacterized protein
MLLASIPGNLQLLTVVAISAVAGAMNAIAGGGTLLTFPALVGLGIPPIVANATSTVALWPGTVSTIWGYRGELRGARRWAVGFAVPSIIGGAVGARLLILTPPARFAAIVPWLVLGATLLFLVQRPALRWLRARAPAAAERTDVERTTSLPSATVFVTQLLLGVYGGYFGAGVGILMLAMLGFMGLSNIHRMNGLKAWGGLCMTAIAAATFAFSGLVDWPVALSMAVASVVGGYAGSRAAQRVPQQLIRYTVAAIGVVGGVWLLRRR